MQREDCFWKGYEVNEEQLKQEVLHETSCGCQNNNNKEKQNKTNNSKET